MDTHVTSTTVVPDDEPPQPSAAVGKLAKSARPEDCLRPAGKLMPHVAAYPTLNLSNKKKGTEQFRYLIRKMHDVKELLRTGVTTLDQFGGDLCKWKK
eukprot:3951874-Prymnesium_polylepis.1